MDEYMMGNYELDRNKVYELPSSGGKPVKIHLEGKVDLYDSVDWEDEMKKALEKCLKDGLGGVFSDDIDIEPKKSNGSCGGMMSDGKKSV